jgi:hypothetical protein
MGAEAVEAIAVDEYVEVIQPVAHSQLARFKSSSQRFSPARKIAASTVPGY